MSAVEWFSNKAYELFEQYSEGKFDRIELNKLMLETTNEAKEMEKEQIMNAFQESRLTHPMIGFKHETFIGLIQDLVDDLAQILSEGKKVKIDVQILGE